MITHMRAPNVVTDPLQLFEKSLQAELDKRPHLQTLNPKNIKEEPGILFRGRLKGYFLCPKLCRVWVLQCMTDARKRGEYFVKWEDPNDESTHDGTIVFAHFFTMRYISLHRPGMSVLFDNNGALKTTSVHFQKLRDYIWAHRRSLARRCHDMAKQAYATKKYGKVAWEPLSEWVISQRSDQTDNLVNFGKHDTALHNVVAKCLWRLAHGSNHPWGLAALKPEGFASVDVTKKVSVRLGF